MTYSWAVDQYLHNQTDTYLPSVAQAGVQKNCVFVIDAIQPQRNNVMVSVPDLAFCYRRHQFIMT